MRDVVVLEKRKKRKLRIKIERKERKMKSRLVGHLCVICCVYISRNKNKNINGSMRLSRLLNFQKYNFRKKYLRNYFKKLEMFDVLNIKN